MEAARVGSSVAQVVVPLTEELVFRGAMLPGLVPCARPTAASPTLLRCWYGNQMFVLLKGLDL